MYKKCLFFLQGKGVMTTYWLLGETPAPPEDGNSSTKVVDQSESSMARESPTKAPLPDVALHAAADYPTPNASTPLLDNPSNDSIV